MAFSSIFDPVFNPLLAYGPFLTVLIISLIISVIIIIAYKYLTNQRLMKEMKDKIKSHQKRMKEFKHDQKKMMQIQKEAMEVNMQYMMHSFKPTLITFLPIIIIYGWLNANIAFLPIVPGDVFTTTMVFDKATTGNVDIILPESIRLVDDTAQQIINNDIAQWKLQATAEGQYMIEYKFKERSYLKELTVTKEQKYAPILKQFKNDVVKTISIDNKKLKLDWKVFQLSWFWSYIIFTLVFSTVLRKLFKIY